jgi:hypothetical protein
MKHSASQNTPPPELTAAERLAVWREIEREIITIRKQSAADFLHDQLVSVWECLALPFLDAEQRRRLSACPLPTKKERLRELEQLRAV